MSIKISKKNTSVSWIDISTGDFFITSFLKENIEDFINKINPAEIIISNQDIEIKRNLEKRISATFTILENKHFSFENNKKSEALKNKEKYSSLELDVIESIYNYLEITQKKKVEFFKNPQLEFENNFVKIDNATRKNLEIIKTVQGEKKGALLHTINKTLTPLGSRLLTLRLQNISANLKIIKNRLDKVSFFYKNNDVSDITFNILKNFPDIERSLSRIMLSRANPKDLGIIRDGVKKSFEIRKNIEKKEVFINNFDLKTFHIAEDIHNYLDKSIICVDKYVKDAF